MQCLVPDIRLAEPGFRCQPDGAPLQRPTARCVPRSSGDDPKVELHDALREARISTPRLMAPLAPAQKRAADDKPPVSPSPRPGRGHDAQQTCAVPRVRVPSLLLVERTATTAGYVDQVVSAPAGHNDPCSFRKRDKRSGHHDGADGPTAGRAPHAGARTRVQLPPAPRRTRRGTGRPSISHPPLRRERRRAQVQGLGDSPCRGCTAREPANDPIAQHP